MKKIVLIIATALMATTAWAQSQQLQTVKGKTKDGKSINVQYYKGTAQDYIESVKYQVVDELKADNKNKQNSINDLQSQLNKANKRIENLTKQLNDSGNSEEVTNLNNQLNEKQSEIDQLNEQLNRLNEQLNASRAENEKLMRQIDSIKAVNLRLSQNKTRLKHPVIGVEGSMGGVFLSKNSLNNPWEKALSWNKQAAIYFGTDRLAENIPLSIEVGVGFRSLPMKAIFDKHEPQNSFADCDGDMYQPRFYNCSERLTINCLEVPIRICIGQPNKNKVSLYTKLGVTPSFTFSAQLANGTYTRQGYYPDWNVTFEDIDELNYFSNGGEDNSKATPSRRFNLWGNAAFGAYLPLSSSILFNVGAKLDYPILKTGTFDADGKDRLLPDGLSIYDGRMFIPSLQAGLVYTLQ